MPLNAYGAEVMRLLARGYHPRGEISLERDEARCRDERDGSFDTLIAAVNLTA